MKIQIAQKNKEAPPKFTGRFSEDGERLAFGSYTKMWLKKFMKANPDMPFEIVPLLPESVKQRGFFEGAVIPLWAFLDKNDYRNSNVLKKYHEYSKLEFNPEIVIIGGQPRKVGGSTKRKLNEGFLEKIIGYLEDNYGIDSSKVLSPQLYKKFRDEIYPSDTAMKYDTFIDYMIDIKILT